MSISRGVHELTHLIDGKAQIKSSESQVLQGTNQTTKTGRVNKGCALVFGKARGRGVWSGAGFTVCHSKSLKEV